MLMLLLTPGVASQSTTTETESELFQSSFRVQFFALLSFLVPNLFLFSIYFSMSA